MTCRRRAGTTHAVLLGTTLLGTVLAGTVLLVAGCSGWGGSDRTLAKVEGWRGGIDVFEPEAILEIAYDAETAQTLWDENVGRGLPDLEGKPRNPGIYGELDDVDFDDEVVGLFSDGESSSCPGWVDRVGEVDGDVDILRVEDMGGGDGCLSDHGAYRVVIVIDRDDVPDADALSTARVRFDGREVPDGVVREYLTTP